MANPEHLRILKQGVKVWNKWREDNPSVRPDLFSTDLSSMTLIGANFFQTRFDDTNLSNSNLSRARLTQASLNGAYLISANLSRADCVLTDFSSAKLAKVDYRGAFLHLASFSRAQVEDADFGGALTNGTIWGGVDLSRAKGLDTIKHYGPSTIGIDTLYLSKGEMPESFLRGCGVPDDFIAFIPSHFNIQQAIQFYSCFISYSTKDEEFARRLYSRMRDEKLRVWFAPEDIKGGQKLHEQIEQAIQLHDRLLLILSENSMQSEWVITEIRRARKTEIEENRRKLFPITLVDFDKIKAWKCFDADAGKDLATEVREYFIPDFSNWKDHDAFEAAFSRLLHDLRAEEKKA